MNTRIIRMLKLSKLLSKYASRWCEVSIPSARMYKWIDEYHDLKHDYPQDWMIYCNEYNLALEHDAFDCFA
jgi:hypothetical protein